MPKVTRSRLSNLWPGLWHICGFAEQEKQPPSPPKINLYHLLPHRIKPMIDWDCSEVVTSIWEGSIQSRVTDRDWGEKHQTGTDGHNVMILGHSTGGLHPGWEVWWKDSSFRQGICSLRNVFGLRVQLFIVGSYCTNPSGWNHRWHYVHVATYKKHQFSYQCAQQFRLKLHIGLLWASNVKHINR